MPIILRLKIEGARRILRGNDHYWRVLLQQTKNGRSTTAALVAMECQPGVEHHVGDFIRRLVKAGFASRRDDGSVELLQRPVLTPALNRDGTICPRAYAYHQMWTVLRRRVQGTTIRDLAMDASTDEVRVTARMAQKYLGGLKNAGLVISESRRSGFIYRLAPGANTGPAAPRLLVSHLIFDPNTDRVVGDETEAEEVTP